MATTVSATDPRNTLVTPLGPFLGQQVGGESYRSPLLPAKLKKRISDNHCSRRHKKSRGFCTPAPPLAPSRRGEALLRRLSLASPIGPPYFVSYLFVWSSWGIFLSKAHPLLGVRVGDVEHLHVAVHRLLDREKADTRRLGMSRKLPRSSS